MTGRRTDILFVHVNAERSGSKDIYSKKWTRAERKKEWQGRETERVKRREKDTTEENAKIDREQREWDVAGKREKELIVGNV